METIILDTDMDTDCDDVGALAMLHTLVKHGEARVLGIVCDIPDHRTARCVQAINTRYGRADIPVGLFAADAIGDSPRYTAYREMLAGAEQRGWQRYNDPISIDFLASTATPPPVETSLSLYRRLLANAPDESLTIVAIGLLTSLEELLESPPDAISPLNGMELVRARVKRFVTMGIGSFPEGQDVFNWKMDLRAAAAVINRWPAPLVVSEWGEKVLTGDSLSLHLPGDHPVRRAYEIYLGGPGKNRSSWDQVALLYGVRGKSDCYSEREGYRIRLDPSSGKHMWSPDPEAIHIHLDLTVPEREMAVEIEKLMVGD